MRILKKPKIKPMTCSNCGCVFKWGIGDLRTLFTVYKEYVECPVCNKLNYVDFSINKENNHVEKS